MTLRSSAAMVFLLVAAAPGYGQSSFVNWESAHVHPLDRTPDGTKLLAVNTADSRIEVFALEDGALSHTASIPVGLDPVSVRARTDTEAWVVNQISDTLSIADLERGVVVATLATEDEPADVIFAGDPPRAFVTCAQASRVLVFDPSDRARAPEIVEIFGEEPRALAVSADGATVYAAIFESGNGSTILGGNGTTGATFPPSVVDRFDGPHDGANPPPNTSEGFSPALNPENPEPPHGSLIVRKSSAGTWLDDSGADWTDFVSGESSVLSGRPEGWDLPDHDVAVIDAVTLEVSYIDALMNSNLAIAVNPKDGRVSVVGLEALNDVRFEPILKGRFIRVHMALVDPATPAEAAVVDLNPHLGYREASVVQSERDRSIGDPRALVWNAAGTRAWIAGKGSNNIIVVDGDGTREEGLPIEVGEGPTGLVLDEAASRLYVLHHFAASISIVDTESGAEVERVSYFDPTPAAIRNGRRHLYDTHATSGLGHIACASCHIDARTDRLAWDLGDPAGEMKPFEQNCLDDVCGDFHPMKGPMLTQTLQDIIGKEPHHWRGDRDGLEEFNGAFRGLLGDDDDLTPTEMQQFEGFLATIHYPPNPLRNFDNTLPEDLPLPGHYTTGRFAPAGEPLPNGNAVRGLEDYRGAGLTGLFECVTCHTLPAGLGVDGDFDILTFSATPVDPGPNGERHAAVTTTDNNLGLPVKIPHLRGLYKRTGFDATQTDNRAGFGFLHDGSVDSLARFVAQPAFSVDNDQQIADLVAFLLAFSGSDLPEPSAPEIEGLSSKDTRAAVGAQVTIDADNAEDAAVAERLESMLALAGDGSVGVVARSATLGAYYIGDDVFQLERLSEAITRAELLEAAADGDVVTFTVVPLGSERRIGADRDDDGFLDGDEIDACSDPLHPDSVPGGGCGAPEYLRGDCNADGIVSLPDTFRLLERLFGVADPFPCDDACDSNDSGTLNIADAIHFLSYLFIAGPRPPAPFVVCGSDPSLDPLDCAAPPASCE